MSEIASIKEIPVQKTEISQFKDSQWESSITLKESLDFWNSIFKAEISGNNNSAIVSDLKNPDKVKYIPKNGGEWTGEVGHSNWKPNPELIPGDRNGTNPEHKTWNELMKQYDFQSIPFKDGEADFSEVSKGQVEIEDFTEKRDANFDQADEKLAEQKGCSPEDIALWREENKYTWHECNDCKTMQMVPTEVHGNITHSGGISEYKSRNMIS